MEQVIKILEDYIELIKEGYCEDCNELCNIYGTHTYPAKKISEATEHLIKAYKELEEKYYYEKNRARNELDTVYINDRYDERDKWKLAIRDIIEENKGYLEYANTAYEYTQREVIEENIKILEKVLEEEK